MWYSLGMKNAKNTVVPTRTPRAARAGDRLQRAADRLDAAVITTPRAAHEMGDLSLTPTEVAMKFANSVLDSYCERLDAGEQTIRYSYTIYTDRRIDAENLDDQPLKVYVAYNNRDDRGCLSFYVDAENITFAIETSREVFSPNIPAADLPKWYFSLPDPIVEAEFDDLYEAAHAPAEAWDADSAEYCDEIVDPRGFAVTH